MKLYGLRKTVAIVATLNLLYFFVEFTFAQIFGSLSLLSDSLDFLEDASINILIFIAFAWSVVARKVLSYVLAFLLLIPGALFIYSAISRLNEPVVPNGRGMSIIGIGALIINLYCAYILIKHKTEEGGLAKAAYLSARRCPCQCFDYLRRCYYSLLAQSDSRSVNWISHFCDEL